MASHVCRNVWVCMDLGSSSEGEKERDYSQPRILHYMPPLLHSPTLLRWAWRWNGHQYQHCRHLIPSATCQACLCSGLFASSTKVAKQRQLAPASSSAQTSFKPVQIKCESILTRQQKKRFACTVGWAVSSGGAPLLSWSLRCSSACSYAIAALCHTHAQHSSASPRSAECQGSKRRQLQQG